MPHPKRTRTTTMTTSASQTHEPLFGIVFEGDYLPGRDPADARARFADRFGDAVASRIFSQPRAVLKRGVSRTEAEHMQGILADMGVVVALAPVATAEPSEPAMAASIPEEPARAPRRTTASMIERAGERSRARTVVRRVEPSVRWQPESERLADPPPTTSTGSARPEPKEDSSDVAPASAHDDPMHASNTDASTADVAAPERQPLVRRTRWSLVVLAIGGLASLAGLAYLGLQLL